MIYGNRRAAALFEIAPEDIPGQCAAEFWVDRGKREWFLTALLSNGRVDDLEVRLRSSNGRVFWARISAQVVRFRGELCLLGGMYDISERKRAQEALRALAATDGLTGAYNRGQFFLAWRWSRSRGPGGRPHHRAARARMTVSVARRRMCLRICRRRTSPSRNLRRPRTADRSSRDLDRHRSCRG